MSMLLHFDDLNESGSPSTHREQLAAKVSLFIVGFLCVTPVALFPLGAASKILTRFLS